jgi:hypothetical protein
MSNEPQLKRVFTLARARIFGCCSGHFEWRLRLQGFADRLTE